MIVTTPSFAFAKAMQASAPPGIIARPGRQSAHRTDDPHAPAILLVAIKEPKPTLSTKEEFVAWLVGEASKDDRCIHRSTSR